VPAFLWANGLTLAVIIALAAVDEVNIGLRWMQPDDRVVSGRVMIALLAATTVQVGAIAAIIARYLFPSRSGAADVGEG
jgi:hypothetical protein